MLPLWVSLFVFRPRPSHNSGNGVDESGLVDGGQSKLWKLRWNHHFRPAACTKSGEERASEPGIKAPAISCPRWRFLTTCMCREPQVNHLAVFDILLSSLISPVVFAVSQLQYAAHSPWASLCERSQSRTLGEYRGLMHSGLSLPMPASVWLPTISRSQIQSFHSEKWCCQHHSHPPMTE